ncbi:MAG: hypothetical protein II275_02890, partial [Bacteroidaceae bacterium]|nr:hypothetical protein [Bacteroidaceae bacterium]
TQNAVRSDPFGGLLRIVFPGHSLSSPQRAVRQLRVLIEKKRSILRFCILQNAKKIPPTPYSLFNQ